MRLLVVSSFYPPHHLGGYELACAASVEGLRARGHEVEVLTTTFRTASGATRPEPAGVARELELYWEDGAWRRPGFTGAVESTLADLAALDRAVRRSRPDAIWAWQLAAVSKSLLVTAARAGLPAVLVLHDLWPLYDRADPWLRWSRGPRRPFGLLAGRRHGLPTRGPDLRRVAGASYNSGWTRDQLAAAGITPEGPVIPPAVDPARFAPGAPPSRARRFLHVGRVEPRKGPAVAVRALAEGRAAGLEDATLTLAGPSEAGHAQEVLALAARLGVAEAVRYLGEVDPEAVPELYRSHDAVIHSATWEEPFGLVIVEAMACGRPVIASPTGGALDLVADGVNALAFAKGDAAACARRMRELADDPALIERLVAEGRRTAERFTVTSMVEAHEAHLRQALAATT